MTEQQKTYQGWRDREWPHQTHVLVNDQPLRHIHKHSSEIEVYPGWWDNRN